MPTIYTSLHARHGRVSARRRELAAPKVRKPATVGKPRRKVIIVGAGLAGLCAAFELQRMDYAVRVYEARGEVGGRVRRDRRFSRNKTVKLGGELIGSNHPLWRAYAKRFKLQFVDVQDYGDAPMRLNGRMLTFDQTKDLLDEFDAHKDKLNLLAETVIDPFEPWTNPNAAALDRQSLSQWLNSLKCNTAMKRLAREALRLQLTTDNGVPARQQSLLGVLAMIKGHGVDRYWLDTELYRCKNGSQQLARKFKSALRPGTVRLNTSIVAISREDHGVVVTVKRGKQARRLKPVDDVILAIPPSVWRSVSFADPALVWAKKRAPPLGRNVKGLMRFERRFWKDFASSPSLTDDGPVDLTWETSEADHDNRPAFTMVAFSGARSASKLSDCASDAERRRIYLAQLRGPYPGIDKALRGRIKFQNWPKEAWVGGSYYFPRVGEVMRWGRFWKDGYAGWLHFIGEHNCYAFMGYMARALKLGFSLALRLAQRDNNLK